MSEFPAATVLLQAKMAKQTKGQPTFVPFVTHRSVPGAQPLFGPASLTREDAVTRVRQALANPIFTAGYVVSRDGIEGIS